MASSICIDFLNRITTLNMMDIYQLIRN
uniref:Uncharacterized protein n=1 Tax=Arundo donax TaxID=35708 RepID=A0A0A9BXA4_ARUDO